MTISTAAVAIGTCLCAAVSAAPSKVPLCEGLTIVTAISQTEGDYESIKTVTGVDARGITIKYSTERVARELPGHPIQKVKTTRVVRPIDLRQATAYLQEFSTITPAEVGGTTAIGTSRDVLAALRSTGRTELTLFDLPSSMPSDHPYSADRNRHPSVFDHEVRFALRRAETAAVMVPLVVNDARVELPALHATATGEWGEKAEFFFLDDDDNPLALRWRIRTSNVSASDRAVLDVVRISYACSASPSAVSALERALAENGRADVYSIFFSFNSDEIREESEPTLREIRDVLRRHPDWNLAIEGHTDGIASDAFNLDLSKRRAAAVRVALIGHYGVDGARLATAGFGRSRPRDTNDTAEGRARNRRVELVRR